MLRSATSCLRLKPRACQSSWYSTPSIPKPWFVDDVQADVTQSLIDHSASSVLKGDAKSTLSLPPDLPEYLLSLHDELSKSPLLEPGGLEIRHPVDTPPGPPLPFSMPKGRRRRGGTDAGEGVPEHVGGIWRWVVLVQVKEGTEGRGAIDSVLRVVRRTLLKGETPLSLPPNRKRKLSDGWGMLDAGNFAVHVLSHTARQQYFPEHSRSWHW